MANKEEALGILRIALDDRAARFRDGQWEAVDALVNRRERLLVVQRTGWGKSAVYFVATRMLRDVGRGPTLIISPLLALMRNQIEAADRFGLKAVSINSSNREDWSALERVVRHDEADALLISPERLANDDFAENVLLPLAGRIGLLVIDEVHCIIPSRLRPVLVPDCAQRLAAALQLAFHPVVVKTKDNEQQKTQQNQFHQCRNLDGVFRIDAPIPAGSVLLLDDVVDSGWTMTVVAALLRQAGCGPVLPVAFATASAGD